MYVEQLLNILNRRLKEAKKDYEKVLNSDADSRFACGRVKALFDLLEEFEHVKIKKTETNRSNS